MRLKKKGKVINKWYKEFENYFKKLNESSKDVVSEIDLNILLINFERENEIINRINLIGELLQKFGFTINTINESNFSSISDLELKIRSYDITFFICLSESSVVGAIELLHRKNLRENIWIFYPIENKYDISYRILADDYGFNKNDNLFSLKKFKNLDLELPFKILNYSLNYMVNKRKKIIIRSIDEMATSSIELGIITALPKELKAVKALIEDIKILRISRSGANKIYFYGKIPTINDSFHDVILAISGVGNNKAAIRATNLIRDISSINSIIMVGIAGGVPNPTKGEEHVRLGDIVVSNEEGVIQYDFIKALSMKNFDFISLDNRMTPSAELVEIAEMLQINADPEDPPWKRYISIGCDKLNEELPSLESDILRCIYPEEREIPHPVDDNRRNGLPKIYLGAIAAGNSVLKDEEYRDYLRDKYNIKAVEMESSGIRDATWALEANFIVIRGICDYCNKYKNNEWQKYAAIIAAAFSRSLIEMI